MLTISLKNFDAISEHENGAPLRGMRRQRADKAANAKFALINDLCFPRCIGQDLWDCQMQPQGGKLRQAAKFSPSKNLSQRKNSWSFQGRGKAVKIRYMPLKDGVFHGGEAGHFAKNQRLPSRRYF